MDIKEKHSIIQKIIDIILDINNELDITYLTASSFVELGGDSFQAMILAARVNKELGIDLPVGEILSNSPLEKIIKATINNKKINFNKYNDKDSPASYSNESAVNINVASTGQHSMWIMQEILGGNAYNLIFLMDMNGPLNIFTLKKAIKKTVQRHEGLKTYFKYTDKELNTFIMKDFQPTFELVDADEGNESFSEVIKLVSKNLKNTNFDLEEKPPLKFVLVTNGESKHTLFIIIHHLLVDGWAVGLLLDELIEHYKSITLKKDSYVESAPSPQIFEEHLQTLRRTGVIKNQLEFWKKALKDYPTIIELPSDKKRPKYQACNGNRIPFSLDGIKSEYIWKTADRYGTTKFTLFLAAYGLLLSRYIGSSRLLIGIPTANRQNIEMQKLIGLCSNVLPVPINIEGNQTIKEYILHVQKSLNNTLNNSDVPFVEIIKELDISGNLKSNPLVQYVFGMHDKLINRNKTVGDLNIKIKDGHGGGSPFDISFFIQNSTPIYTGEIEYSSDTFLRLEMMNLLESFVSIIEDFYKLGSEVLIENVRSISQGQYQQLEKINNTEITNYHGNIEHLFMEQAKKNPNAIAIDDPNKRTVTYKDLEIYSRVQAKLLINKGVKIGDKVIIALDRSIEEIVGLLGVLRAGAVYMAVNPEWPSRRLKTIIQNSSPEAIIASDKYKEKFASIMERNTKILKPWNNSWPIKSDEIKVTPKDPERLAYIAFTSGSTGVPKGVAVPHRGVIRLVDSVEYIDCEEERFLRFAPLAFDASTLEIWAPLLNGGTCVIYPPKTPSPHELGDFLKNNNITRLWLTSGLFRVVAEFTPESFFNVRQLLTGGDVVPTHYVRRIKEINPKLVITNGYGPTENTTFTTTYTVNSLEDIEDPLPIGKPVPNTRIYILDNDYRILPPGAIGELCIAGKGLAKGYLNSPEETAKSFGFLSTDINEFIYKTGDMVRLDTRGRIRYLGRKDHQVKIRGHRIELEEVQNIINSHNSVKDSIVFTTGSTSTNRRLLAGVVLKNNKNNDLENIKNHLKEILPDYMLPSLWAVVDKIPINHNGKVDRNELEQKAKQYSSNKNKKMSSENKIVDSNSDLLIKTKNIYLRILELDSVTEDGNFFNLGGDSLKMARLIALIRNELSCNLSIREFYTEPTLRNLVKLIVKQKGINH